ncbi:bifunctional phosphoribosylaminoimidazolecarboxamide formyltransferase/IMP cyclohydrolase [Paenibacillus sp. 481]|uniref:bifunctional phosphoribosylaminoimidazolecarboxamide formyltransferase/IMP cyclohydrolase n=1 Tax=Paenibacillus sp. 481 TaxID=2835869 RepID=UPI001E610E89|nr:bifunctional phosphoribosylaminoimidazolecarboxamide formyltransferase/IMP cyclohydrolase [Paenibacillus sp. 481]UHA74722.1 bifunctional phosphoribosylaminoimidazolecarboxamide formyltransferase/IMP cyclohydrolase [Paenibacillus sp. 481]
MAIKRALISVSDKSGVVEFARALAEAGVELISTGGTKSLLEREGVPVIGISDVTGFPEILDGRVKTLHPAVHSGLLAVRDNAAHQKQLEELGLSTIDLVIVNLYPFQQTIENPAVSYEDAIENIDIGGPTMLRSAAKNHAFVTVAVDASDYGTILEEVQANGDTSLTTRKRLAAKVFRHTASYDALIADYLCKQVGEEWPERLTVTYERVQTLRYGENPHQQAAFYRLPIAKQGSLVNAEQLHGKELSYNNINDANAALAVISEFEAPAVVAIKHMNPCGVGIGETIAEAYQKAYAADPTSIFGGIIAANRMIDEGTARSIAEIFLEIVIAPEFTPEALTILTQKKNIRLLRTGVAPSPANRTETRMLTSVDGGVLIQDQDIHAIDPSQLKVVTERQPTEAELNQLLLAWKVVKHVKSNAIVLVQDDMTVGVGAGQMNRVGAAKIAIEQAGAKAQGAVLASDAFFPLGDTMELAAQAGIKAVIQPGGSIRDEESIRVANEHGIAMVFTSVRHFKH